MKIEFIYYFSFFFINTYFSIKITHISLNSKDTFKLVETNKKFSLLRRDIVDRNGIIISRNINTYHAAINPNQIKDKKNFLIKLRLNFPDLPINQIEKKLNEGKYFRLKKELIKLKKTNFGHLAKKQLNLSLSKQECILMEIYLAI